MAKAVQSAERCLSVLEFINVRNGATQREVCGATGLTRGSAYRILETLRQQGYLRKDKGSLHYWLTARVQSLATGYKEDAWVERIAAPIINELGRTTKWPVKFLTPIGAELLTRITTDYESPFTERKYPTGWRVDLLSSAAGCAYLAHCDPATRTTLLKLLKNGSYIARRPRDRKANMMGVSEINAMIKRIRAAGYEIRDHPDLAFYTLAVPVLSAGTAVGAIAIHFFRAAVTRDQAISTFLPILLRAARTLGDALGQEGSGPGAIASTPRAE